MFNFGPPPGGQPPQTTQTQPAPAAPSASPFGAPPPAFGAGPVDPAQALAGFGDAAIDLRDPFLPLGFAGKVRIDSTEGKVGRNVGYAIYIRCTVTAVANPGGGQQQPPLPKNVNLVPASVGSKYAIRIDGFNKEDAKAFAASDLKLFMIAALERNGLTHERAQTLTPQQWNDMGAAVHAGKLGCEGAEILVSTSSVGTKAGFAKQKTAFYPLSAAG